MSSLPGGWPGYAGQSHPFPISRAPRPSARTLKLSTVYFAIVLFNEQDSGGMADPADLSSGGRHAIAARPDASASKGGFMAGAHEAAERAEHMEHAAGRNKRVALLIALVALCLAFSETLGK